MTRAEAEVAYADAIDRYQDAHDARLTAEIHGPRGRRKALAKAERHAWADMMYARDALAEVKKWSLDSNPDLGR